MPQFARRLPTLLGAAVLAGLLVASPALAGPPFPPNCRCTLVACPSGDLIATVQVRDNVNAPVPFANVVVQLGGAAGLQACAGGPIPPLNGQTDINGQAQFTIAARGAANGGAQVFANGTPICNNAPVAGPDLTGNGLVDVADMQIFRTLIGSPALRADLDGNGIVSPNDTLIAAAHVSDACTGSYELAAPTPGAEFALALDLDDATISMQFQGGGTDLDTLSGQMVLTLGPRLSPNDVRIELTQLGMFSAGLIGPRGNSGYLEVVVDDSQGTPTGTWASNGHFAIGPFRALLHSTLADSIADVQVPDSIDVVPISGDSVLCTLSGTITPSGDDYQVGWSMTIVPTNPPSQYLLCDNGDTQQNGKTFKRQSVECDPCKTLCIIPVILADDNGANPGINNADLKKQLDKAAAIWEKCCVMIRQAAAAITIKSTALNTWGNGETLAAHTKAVRDKLAEKQADGKPLADERMLELCVVMSFMAHGAGPDGGGEAFLNGADLAVNLNHLKTKCPGPPPATNPDPDDRVCAHELGHIMGLPQAHVAGQNCMSDCAPSDNVTGGMAEGDEGGLSGQCEVVYKCKKLFTDANPKPCFKVGGRKKKCVIKLKCT